jgi:hypothetical protein
LTAETQSSQSRAIFPYYQHFEEGPNFAFLSEIFQMKRVIFVQHAMDRMSERSITQELVKSTLNHPDNIDCRNEKRKMAQRFIEGRLLRIIYEEDDDAIVVVSAYCTSRVNKYIRRY